VGYVQSVGHGAHVVVGCATGMAASHARPTIPVATSSGEANRTGRSLAAIPTVAVAIRRSFMEGELVARSNRLEQCACGVRTRRETPNTPSPFPSLCGSGPSECFLPLSLSFGAVHLPGGRTKGTISKEGMWVCR